MGSIKDSQKTRAKLIESAGKLFSEKGFKSVTVRDIAQTAKTHLSALNYHFKTKNDLYQQVLLEASKANVISLNDQKQLLKLDAQQAIFIIIKHALLEYSSNTPSSWKTILLTRECQSPSEFFDQVVEIYLKPDIDFLSILFSKAANKKITDDQVKFAVLAMAGLIETFGLHDHLIKAVAPNLKKNSAQINRLAQQISRMVLEAVN